MENKVLAILAQGDTMAYIGNPLHRKHLSPITKIRLSQVLLMEMSETDFSNVVNYNGDDKAQMIRAIIDASPHILSSN